MVCDKDVCERWWVTKLCVCVKDGGVTEEEAEESGGGGHGGCRSKNRNPTLFCGEQHQLATTMTDSK